MKVDVYAEIYLWNRSVDPERKHTPHTKHLNRL